MKTQRTVFSTILSQTLATVAKARMISLLFLMLILPVALLAQTTYYVSSSSGNDGNNGTSTTTPWQTLTKISRSSFNAGDHILLKRGDVFEGEISQTFTGTSSNRIVIDAYGTGGKPIIYGDMSFHTWTAVPGRVGYYKTWCGRTVETYGYEYYSGAWQQMTHQEGEIQFYLSNADSLRKFLDSFVASSYGPGAGGSDTIWVRTNDSNAPGQLHIFREGSFADGSYVTVQNLEFRNYRTALKALTGDHLIWRHIKTLNCMNEAMFLSTGTHDCLIDSCYCDSTSRTCIYNYFGSRNWFKYDTVNHEMDGVLGISQGGEQCGLGFESDNACGADHCLVENVIDSGVDTYLNLGDTVRYCTFIGMQGGIYLHGEQWVAHNNNIITGGDIGPAISVTLCKAGTVEQLGGTGQDHIYNNTINCFATGQGVESVFGTSATILFEHNDVTGQQSNSNLDKFDATTGLTSINNSFHSPGRFNATPYPNEVFYTSLSAFQAATGLESGSVWNSDASSPTGTLTITPSSFSFGNVIVNTISSKKTYTVQGSNLSPASDSLTITAPSGFTISTDSSSGFTSSKRIAYTGGTLSAKTIYVRFSPTAVQSYTGNITNAGGGATTQNVAVTGSGISAPTPALTVNPTSLSFGNVTINMISSKLTYTLTGLNLSPAADSLTITAPSGFTISTDSSSGFTSSKRIAYTGGTLSAKTIYVRFSPTAVQSYTGNITNAGGGATTQNVAVTGTGISATASALTVNPTSLSFGNVTINTISSELTYTLVGLNLSPASDSLTITAPSGFTISTDSSSGFTSSKRIAYTGGTLSAKTIYVRFSPTAVQSYTGNITNAGGGATTQNVAVTGSGISAPTPALTVNPTSLSFGNVTINMISSKLTYTLTGLNLSPAADSLTITAPSGFTISTDSSSGFTSSKRIAYTGGTLSAKTIYVRFSPTAVQSYTGNITNAGGGATTQNVAVTGTGISATASALTVNPTSLSFGNVTINTISSELTYTLVGLNLSPASDSLTITAPSGFTISTDSSSGFTSSKRIAYTSGTLQPIPKIIYVRFSPTTVQSYSDSITIGGGGAVTKSVFVSGNGLSDLPPPTGTFIASSDTLPERGGSVTLTWTSSNASSASINNGIGTVVTNGSITRIIRATTRFTLILSNINGNTSYVKKVYVRPQKLSRNKALDMPSTASTVELTGDEANKANDGNPTTRWSSAYTDNQWWQVDLQDITTIDHITITWDSSYASQFTISTSLDGLIFTDVVTGYASGPDTIELNFDPVNARYVRLIGIQRGTQLGISFFELGVYESLTTSVESTVQVPSGFLLEQNFPNPFNPSTEIGYQLSTTAEVRLIVYDILGKEIVTLVNQVQQAGHHTVTFNANNLASGMYYARLKAEGKVQIRKMMLTK